MNNRGQDLETNNDFCVVLWIGKQQIFEGVSTFKISQLSPQKSIATFKTLGCVSIFKQNRHIPSLMWSSNRGGPTVTM